MSLGVVAALAAGAIVADAASVGATPEDLSRLSLEELANVEITPRLRGMPPALFSGANVEREFDLVDAAPPGGVAAATGEALRSQDAG